MIVSPKSVLRSKFPDNSMGADSDYIKKLRDNGDKDGSYNEDYYNEWEERNKAINVRPESESIYYNTRNPYKELIMTMEGINVYEDIDGLDDWRDLESNGVCQVNKRIGLFLESMDFVPKVDYSPALSDSKDFLDMFRTGVDKIKKVKQTFDALSTLASTSILKSTPLRGNDLQVLIRRISKIKGFDPHKVGSIFDGIDFTINFSFGQFGLFDAYEEVVKPVCALLGVLAPRRASYSANSGVEYYRTPYPTENIFTGLQVSGVFSKDDANQLSKLKEMAGAGFGDAKKSLGGGDVGGAVSGAIDTTLALMNGGGAMLESIINKGAKNVLKNYTGYGEHQYRFANFRYGTIKVGPCFLTEINGKFDSSKIDENGYPYKGSVVIKAKDMRTLTSEGLNQMFHKFQKDMANSIKEDTKFSGDNLSNTSGMGLT